MNSTAIVHCISPKNYSRNLRSAIMLMVTLALIAAALLMTVGCAGTSAPFQLGTVSSGPLLAKDLAAYAGAPDADIEAFRAATATQKEVDFQKVSDAWDKVRLRYAAFVAADPTLSDKDKTLRLTTGIKFDDLLAAERKRKALFAPTVDPN